MDQELGFLGLLMLAAVYLVVVLLCAMALTNPVCFIIVVLGGFIALVAYLVFVLVG